MSYLLSTAMNDKLILVVEDNPDHLELTVLTLEEQGVTAEIAVARAAAAAPEGWPR
jgi:two-component system response regulator